jgi:hypothetical protein
MANERSYHDPRTELAQPNLEALLAPRGVRPVVDLGFGEGYGLEIGQPETPVDLLVFPKARGVIVASETLHVELAPVISVSRRGDRLGLVSENAEERSTLEITPWGGLLLTRQAITGAPELREPSEGSETQQRLTIRGRVGRTPRFRTTQGRGMLIGQFPLAEHRDDGETTWHTILVFGERAAKLKERPIQTGQEIEIVGYPHERTRRSRFGSSRQVTELYATAIRTTLKDTAKDTYDAPAEDA